MGVPKKRVEPEAKGAGAQRSNITPPAEKESEVSGVKEAAASTLTPFDVFGLCIARARNLIKIHKAAHGRRAKPEKYLSDAHRASIVLAVSALDAFIRTFVIQRVTRLLADRDRPLPSVLSERIQSLIKGEVLLEAARKYDLLDRVEKAFRGDFARKSFQGTRNIEDCMKLVGYDDIFHEVAVEAGLNEDTLREDLDRYTARRHAIAHRGDYDLTKNPPDEQSVTQKDANECIKLVEKIAEHIHRLEASQ
ncbi:MAG: HEPN domain-containing protein [Phycisphaerae bacterium]